MLTRMFLDHPRSLGMSWKSHGAGAVRIGLRMIGGGLACLVHAVMPSWFTETAGRTVNSLHEHMVSRRASAPDPQNWPDYEI